MFTLKYTNDINTITLSKADLHLDGFSANVDIRYNGNNRTVILSNIHSTSNTVQKSVYVAAGTAVSSDGKQANGIQTETFTIQAKQPEQPTDTTAPVAKISGPSASKVYAGGTVTYKITYSDNVGIHKITLNNNDITLSGFTANKNISINGNVATITLSNIQGNIGGNKKIYVAAGTAIDAQANQANGGVSSEFSIVEKNNNNNNNNNNNKNDNKNNNNGKASDWVANPNTGK